MPSTSPRSEAVHHSALVIDSHADTPQRFLDERFDLADPLGTGDFNLETARRGNLGAQFFAIWVEPSLYEGQFARRALELIDAVQQQVSRHARDILFVTTAEGIEQAHREGKLAVLMTIEGGHAIEDSLGLLRQYYALGARSMTLTWTNSNGWADSSGDSEDATVAHTAEGLSAFGEEVIGEMNRLGMIVDISHVSDKTFYRTLAVSRAPVIASHSCSRTLCRSPRNLTDEMIRALANTGGVVQVNFYSGFVSQEYRDALEKIKPEIARQTQALKNAAEAEGRELSYHEIARVQKAAADGIPRPPLSLLIDHIDHIAQVAGVEHVGLGSDFDGIASQLPEGIDSPADLPKITGALMERGYSADDCHKILGGNLLRVFREVEAVSRDMRAEAMSPIEQ